MMNQKTAAAVGIGLMAISMAGCGNMDEGDDQCTNCDPWNIAEGQQPLNPCVPTAVDRDSEHNVEVLDRTWEQEKLVERVETVEFHDRTSEYATQWSYEDGRIQEATTTIDGEVVGVSAWEYDGFRPVEVTRRLHGSVVERQAWRYDGMRLLEREVEVVPEGMDGDLDSVAFREARHTIEQHDDLGVRILDRSSRSFSEPHSPWNDANIHLQTAEDDGCYQLPASPGHGYPEDGDSYHIGISGEYSNSATGKAYDYGYNGFNPQPWYGHTGVATSWPFDMQHPREEGFHASIEYDDQGRMESETLSFVSGADEVMSVERQRAFDDRGLNSDSVTVDDGRSSGEADLRFERDDAGNLQQREHFWNDELVSRQTWSFADGRAQTLELYMTEPSAVAHPPNPGPEVLVEEPGDGELVHVTTYERSDER